MINSNMQTLNADEFKTDAEHIQLATVSQVDNQNISMPMTNGISATKPVEGVSAIGLVLALSFISIVTISRRPH